MYRELDPEKLKSDARFRKRLVDQKSLDYVDTYGTLYQLGSDKYSVHWESGHRGSYDD
jgi:hypothetical protein